MALFLITSTLLLAAILWPTFNLIKNYIIARKLGLPILITPLGLLNPFWQLGQNQLAPLLKRLPFKLGYFAEYSSLVSLFDDRYRRHAQLGDAYMLVSPTENIVVVADALAADEIMRLKDFIKPEALYKPLELFGPNVNTMNGEDWQRHRKVTTPPFNEKNSKLVWREAIKQAKGMLMVWREAGESGVLGTEEDAMTFALHVLTAAGFGHSYEFNGGLAKPVLGHSLTYRQAMHIILHDIVLCIIVGSIWLPSKIMPQKVTKVKQAIKEFKQYMVEMVENERQCIHRGESTADNLLSILVRSADQNKLPNGQKTLSDDEIYGNLFIYNVAGHDTASGTLAHCLVLLAANPVWQDWIGEEIDYVFQGKDPQVEDYALAFPRLKRCLALMFETLRSIGTFPYLPKITGLSTPTLTIGNRKIVIPQNTFVYLQMSALHTDPTYWGEDSLVWRPDRWITSSDHVEGIPDFEGERLVEHVNGRFLPWARICPGRKFSQVEFVGAIATLFRGQRVRPVREVGESVEGARERLMGLLEDMSLTTTLRMNHPERLKLIWEERV